MSNNLQTYSSFSGVDITAVFDNTVFGEIQMVSYKIDREKAPVYTMGSADLRTIARGKRLVSGACVFVVFDRDSLLYAFQQSKSASYYPALNNTDTANLNNPGATTAAQLAGGTVNPFANGAGQTLANSIATSTNFANSIKTVGPAQLADQLLAFDITLVGTNEYGASTKMVINGVELMSEASGVSIDDLVIEKQFSFIARRVQNWSSGLPVTGSSVYNLTN